MSAEKLGRRKKKDIQHKELSEAEREVFDDVIGLIGKIPEIRNGKTEVNLGIERDEIVDIIKWERLSGMFDGSSGLNFLLEHEAEVYLKARRIGSLLDFVVRNAENGFSVQASVLGSDAGITSRRDGFVITAADTSTGISTNASFIPVKIPPASSATEFLNWVNQVGGRFVDQLNQEPTLNQLKLTQSLIDHAMHPEKPIPLSLHYFSRSGKFRTKGFRRA
ncbi:MAG: hypothetical protein AAB675_03830 [Patescibacteria group bacterium]